MDGMAYLTIDPNTRKTPPPENELPEQSAAVFQRGTMYAPSPANLHEKTTIFRGKTQEKPKKRAKIHQKMTPKKGSKNGLKKGKKMIKKRPKNDVNPPT
jgi:hypothetical protein